MGIAAQCLHGARICVIPRPENDYRPLALRHRSLVAVSALLVAAKVVAIGVVGLMPAPAELATITTARILQLTNVERTRAGLQELTMNEKLIAAARQKAQDMLDQDYFAHISPRGVTPWFWMNKAGYRYQVAGENLAIDFLEAEDVVAAWMASPTHRANIVHADFTESGIGVMSGEFEGGTSIVVVHMFGLPHTPAPPAPTLVRRENPAVLSATPQPSAVIARDTTAPGAPEVVPGAGEAVRESVQLTIRAEAKSTVAILVNNQQQAAITVPASGIAELAVPVTELPDGELVIRAVARDQAGNQSSPSAAQSVIKDTSGPEIALEQVSFIVSPATDAPRALVHMAATNYDTLAVRIAGEESVFSAAEVPTFALGRSLVQLAFFDRQGNAKELTELSLLPSFTSEADTSYLVAPGKFSRYIWRITLSAALVVFLLLSLAVIIQIQIQRPRMIAHAIFVLLLAGTLLLW